MTLHCVRVARWRPRWTLPLKIWLLQQVALTNANRIGISWVKPEFNGGSEIVDYTIEYAK